MSVFLYSLENIWFSDVLGDVEMQRSREMGYRAGSYNWLHT